jgi:acetyl-CoA carboxylase carboxyltransferase component
VRAFAAARVPRATVVLRKAFGGAFITMNSKDLGATLALSWPNAEIGIMSAHAAVEIIHGRELAGSSSPRGRAEYLARRYAEEHLSAEAALRRGAIDALIEPRETRERVAAALLSPRAADARLPDRAFGAPFAG